MDVLLNVTPGELAGVIAVIVIPIPIALAAFWFADWYGKARLDAMTLNAIDEAHEHRVHPDPEHEELAPDSSASDGLRG